MRAKVHHAGVGAEVYDGAKDAVGEVALHVLVACEHSFHAAIDGELRWLARRRSVDALTHCLARERMPSRGPVHRVHCEDLVATGAHRVNVGGVEQRHFCPHRGDHCRTVG